MIGHAFQISDGTMEKDFDVAFFPTFVEENDWSDGVMILRQFQRSTR